MQTEAMTSLVVFGAITKQVSLFQAVTTLQSKWQKNSGLGSSYWFKPSEGNNQAAKVNCDPFEEKNNT